MKVQALSRERLSLLGRGLREEAACLEDRLVGMLVQGCQFDLQSGYTELGVSKIQAAIEFAVLAPQLSTAVPGPGMLPVCIFVLSAYFRSFVAVHCSRRISYKVF